MINIGRRWYALYVRINGSRGVSDVRHGAPGCGAIVLTGALGLAACGSNGGGSVSQSQLEKKLKNDPQVTQLTARLKGSQADIVLSCVAKALKKDADSSDLKDYLNGKKNLADIGGKTKGSAQKVNTDARACASKATGG